MTPIGQSGLWVAGLQPVLVYKPGGATGHTGSEGRNVVPGTGRLLLKSSCSHSPSKSSSNTGSCVQRVVPRQHVPALLWLHPCLPCGDDTRSGEVAAMNTCDNAEYPI